MSDFDLATVDRLLSTTRAVRRRLDFARPVPRPVVLDCIRLSQQAPTASNTQSWRWLLVDDPQLRRQLGAIYAQGIPTIEAAAALAQDRQTRNVYESALWLASRMGEVPLLALPCVAQPIPAGAPLLLSAAIFGSIYPAVWSFQLALRSRGLGSAFTTLHLLFAAQVRAVLSIPDDVTTVALLPVAYTTGGDFRPAVRPPVETIVHWNTWGAARA